MKVSSRSDTGLSLDASFNGAAFDITHLEGFSAAISATENVATLAGDFQVQASNNAFGGNGRNPNDENPNATWVDIAGACATISGADQVLFDVSVAYYSAVRITWTRTGGEGDADIHYNAKGHI